MQNNGGPTWTHSLGWNSPAIDSGDNDKCQSSDQRGVPRPQDGDNDSVSVCDIGSYEKEYQPASPTLVKISGAGFGSVDQGINLTASIEPISTTIPVTYTWQATGQALVVHTSGLTDTISYTWSMTGTKTVTVTANNMVGSISDTHMMTIYSYVYKINMPVTQKYYAPFVNGDFEQGVLGWSLFETSSIVSDENGITPHGGNKMASIISYGIVGINPGYIEQSFTVPSNSSFISFWWSSYVSCDPLSGDRCGGDLSMSVNGTPLISKHVSGGGTRLWEEVVLDISSFRGSSITLQFSSGSYRDAIYNYIDDISFQLNP